MFKFGSTLDFRFYFQVSDQDEGYMSRPQSKNKTNITRNSRGKMYEKRNRNQDEPIILLERYKISEVTRVRSKHKEDYVDVIAESLNLEEAQKMIGVFGSVRKGGRNKVTVHS